MKSSWILLLLAVVASQAQSEVCKFTGTNGKMYDLTPLKGRIYLTPNGGVPGYTEYIAVCDEVVTGISGCASAAVCERKSGSFSGTTIATPPVTMSVANDVLSMTYVQGNLGCLTAKINFFCDPTAGLGNPLWVSEQSCTMLFTWRTVYACETQAPTPTPSETLPVGYPCLPEFSNCRSFSAIAPGILALNQDKVIMGLTASNEIVSVTVGSSTIYEQICRIPWPPRKLIFDEERVYALGYYAIAVCSYLHITSPATIIYLPDMPEDATVASKTIYVTSLLPNSTSVLIVVDATNLSQPRISCQTSVANGFNKVAIADEPTSRLFFANATNGPANPSYYTLNAYAIPTGTSCTLRMVQSVVATTLTATQQLQVSGDSRYLFSIYASSKTSSNTTVFVHDSNNLARAVFGVFLTSQVIAGQFNRESTLLAVSYVEGVNVYDTMGILVGTSKLPVSCGNALGTEPHSLSFVPFSNRLFATVVCKQGDYYATALVWVDF